LAVDSRSNTYIQVSGMKSFFIYWCTVTTSLSPCEKVSGAIQVDSLVTAYIHPYGYTDFEITEAEFYTGEEWINQEKQETVTHGTFLLEHPHGFGVMHVTSKKVILYVTLSSEQTKFQDTQVFLRKNTLGTCKCRN